MGIEISTRAELPKVGLFRKPASCDLMFRRIQDAVNNAIKDDLLSRAIRFDRHHHTLCVQLHPAGCPLEFTWEPEGHISLYTKTSTAGPGFHAFSVQVLKHIGDRCSLQWNWRETDFCDHAVTGSFQMIQQEMAGMLKTIAQTILSECHEASALRVNMAIEYPQVRADMFVVSPMGPFSWKWWEELSYAEGAALEAKCREFFPWWDEDQDAIFWRNFGLVLLWAEVPWHVPANKEERDKCQLAIDCLHRARTLDVDLDIPEAEIRELAALLRGTEQESQMTPRPGGIGYRRGVMGFLTTGGWSVDLPGYYYTDWTHDGKSIVFWFGGRTVHISSLTVEAKDGGAISKEDLVSQARESGTSEAETVAFEEEHLLGQAFVRLISEDGREYWELRGVVGCGAGANTLAIVTICYDDPADKTWAVSTFKTVFHPAPDDESEQIVTGSSED